ncbi:uncharacterized protein LOC135842438 isoform X2 [Planococcus citri]|uniref:uncharacterized protein LOC135842438 isoform X2 n=1 Tax=Planococcus citri TaxID=170843 RepID=UPI0031F920C6
MANRRIHEANDPVVENHEDRFVYFDVPVSLQALAADEIARSIWHSNLSTYHPIKKEESNVIPLSDLLEYCDEYGYQQQQTKQMINDLKVPRSVEEKLDNSLKSIRKRIRDWVVHLLQIVFNYECLRGSHEIRGIDPRWCVWRANGGIEYEDSAKKIIEMGDLSDLQKFLIMCEYCFDDMIKKFSLDLLPSEFIDEVDFATHRSCFYWIRYLKNELHKMPLENPTLADVDMSRTRDIIINYDYCPVEEYDYYRFSNLFFWYRLSDDDQVTVVAAWIRHGHPSEYMLLDQIVSEMSWYQQQRLLSEMNDQIDQIILDFISCHDSPRLALWIWKHLKDNMPAEQFIELFCNLIFSDIKTCTLVEFWQTASDHQRNYFIANMSKEFINTFIRDILDIPGSLMIDGLINERRNLMLKNNIQGVISLYDESLLNRMLDSASPGCDDDHLTVMKLGIDSFRFLKHLERMYCNRNLKKLDEELKSYFLNDINAAREYKRLYLTHVDQDYFYDGIRLVTNFNLWNEFCNYIDEAFDYDLARTSQVKQRIVSSVAVTLVTIQSNTVVTEPQYYLDLRRGFDDLVKIFEMVFEDNDELRDEKRAFYGAFYEYKSRHAFANIDKEFKLKLKRWCVGLKKTKNE